MARKRSEGLEALVPKLEPVSIQEITMQDWYAAFALMNMPASLNHEDAAREAWDRAEAAMKERERRM